MYGTVAMPYKSTTIVYTLHNETTAILDVSVDLLVVENTKWAFSGIIGSVVVNVCDVTKNLDISVSTTQIVTEFC